MSNTVWANALLSDGKILFWYTGSKCNEWDDFYKDFYYAGISSMQYEKSHKLELVCKELDGSDNHKAFEIDAPDFYRQYEISPDSRGRKPYGENVPFVPPKEDQAVLKPTIELAAGPHFCTCGAPNARPFHDRRPLFDIYKITIPKAPCGSVTHYLCADCLRILTAVVKED